MIKCDRCQKLNENDSKYCMYCGSELKHELIETKETEEDIILDEVECPNCKTINNGLSNYC